MSTTKEFLANYRDYPLEVTIETTGRCNARCVFCPHDELERKHRDMSDELFSRIIDQLKEIPRTHRFYISPFKVNELFMDKKIFERISLINENLPNAYIRLFSNFNMVTEDDIRRLCQIENIADIYISLNSLDKEEYQQLMNLHLDKTLSNIFLFLDYIRQHGIRMQSKKITLSRVARDSDSDSAYLQTFASVFKGYEDLVMPRIIPLQEWIDYLPSEIPLRQDQSCSRWADINICCNGVVAFCCMDGRGAFPWGNVLTSTALEIYNQPAYRRLRLESPPKSQITPCRYCSQ